MTAGEKIKALRKSKGFTQTELGAKLGVQKNAVSKWECGRVDDIPTSKIKAMASLFGVKPSYLIDDKSEIDEQDSKKLAEFDELENELVKLFRLIPPERRALVLELVKTAIKNL